MLVGTCAFNCHLPWAQQHEWLFELPEALFARFPRPRVAIPGGTTPRVFDGATAPVLVVGPYTGKVGSNQI